MYRMVCDFFDHLLGLHVQAQDLTFEQMAWRTLVVFIFGVVLVRIADRRFLGRNAGFDVLLGFILGSVLSRGINGQAAFFPTLGASAVLIALHHLLGTLACRFDFFSRLVKGDAAVLVRKGKVDRIALRKSKMSDDDLEENLRTNGNVANPSSVVEARLERNGLISVVKNEKDRNA